MRNMSQKPRVRSQKSRSDGVFVIRHLSSFFRSRILVFSFLVFSFFSSLNLFSQKISATVDRDKILIGEQIELKVLVTDIDKSNADVSHWFDLPDSFNHMEIVKRFPIDTISAEGTTNYSQKIILTSFDSGVWQIPAITVSFAEKISINALPISISVLPVDVSNLKEYHDFKEIIEVKPETDWLFLGSIAASVIVLGIIMFLVIRYFRRRKLKPKQVSKIFGIKEVLQQLDDLETKGLIEKQQHKLFFTELITICKNFSDEQLNIYSANKTTDEYMLMLKNKVGNEPAQIRYFQILRLADAVKFAKFIPPNNECTDAVFDAKTFVQTIYHFQFSKKD